MKKIIAQLSLLALISFATESIFAQEKTLIASFASFPVGDFGSTDLDKGGFAETGWGIALDSRMSGKKWPKGLEAYFHSTYQWNKMNTEAVAQAYTEYLITKPQLPVVVTVL